MSSAAIWKRYLKMPIKTFTSFSYFSHPLSQKRPITYCMWWVLYKWVVELTYVWIRVIYLYYVAVSCTCGGQSHLWCRFAQFWWEPLGNAAGLVCPKGRIFSWYMACTLGASPWGSHKNWDLGVDRKGNFWMQKIEKLKHLKYLSKKFRNSCKICSISQKFLINWIFRARKMLIFFEKWIHLLILWIVFKMKIRYPPGVWAPRTPFGGPDSF